MEDRYLGDGVYASFDGHTIWLELKGQEPTLPVTKIALEPDVMQALMDYKKELEREMGYGT